VCLALHVSTPNSNGFIDIMHSVHRALHALDLRGRFAAGVSMSFAGRSRAWFPSCAKKSSPLL
jgi:hypothetical protein